MSAPVYSCVRWVSLFLVATLFAYPAAAQEQLGGYEQSAKLLIQLLGLFVTATILESALTTIFQWRLYREFVNGRGAKTLVTIIVSFLIVRGFDYDIFAKVLSDAGAAATSTPTSQAISALVLSGGSAAIYQLLVTLCFRTPVNQTQSEPKPPENLAWISVRFKRKRAVGDIRIHVDEVRQPTPELSAIPALSGTIGNRVFRERLRGMFFADPMRFPTYGGITVKANTVYRVLAIGRKAGDGGSDAVIDFEQEIFTGRFASRAIADFVHEV